MQEPFLAWEGDSPAWKLWLLSHPTYSCRTRGQFSDRSDQRRTFGPLQKYMTDSSAGSNHCVELSVALPVRKSDCLPRSSISILCSVPAYFCASKRAARTFSTLCGHVSCSSGSISRKHVRAGRTTRAFLRFRHSILGFQFLYSQSLSFQVPHFSILSL
jgi:hypothetical protein